MDVMDGNFVPNLSTGPQVVRSLRPLADRFDARLHVHLMIHERAGAGTKSPSIPLI